MLVRPPQAEGEFVCLWRLLMVSSLHLDTCVHSCVAQNPNVAFDFDHWEECEEDSPFSKGKMDRMALRWAQGRAGRLGGHKLFLGILPLWK